jgi:AcrR family transcriptional regulator
MPRNSRSTDVAAAIREAAKACYQRVGIEKTGMEDIAREAGIARSTLYRYYPRHDELLLAVVTDYMRVMNQQLEKKLARYKTPADKIVEGLILAIRAIPEHPLLSRVFAQDEGGMLRRSLWNSQAMVELGVSLMGTVLQEAREQGQLQQTVASEVLVEWVYRILLSFISLPSNWAKTDKALRTTLRALLIPVVLKEAPK